MNRRIEVSKSGSNATVVWNPWIAKSKAMPDFGDEEWPGMVCVETVNAAKHAVELAPGAMHSMTQRVRVL
jgi:glucose-6-phosphate 1-epimerase